MSPQRLVLASHNAGKLRELQALLDPSGQHLKLEGAAALGLVEPDEPHPSFLENALAKARAASAASGLPALADDSGLCVNALGGRPGVQSSTWAGPLAAQPGEDREALRRRQDRANIEALWAQWQATAAPGQAPDPRARFVCTLVAVRHALDPEPLVAQGRWEGRLQAQAAGEGGFGYDPVMWFPEGPGTASQMPAAQKNACSHRALAVALLRPQLVQAWGWTL